MTSMWLTRVMSRTRAFVLLAALGGCEAVPFAVQPEEAALLPPEMAVEFLRSLPAGSSTVALRPDNEHCEFRRNGLRVAAANPSYVQRVVDAQRAELKGVARERETLEREQRRVEESQRDRTRWMRSNGFIELADEQRRLEAEHQSPERWLQARGLPSDQLARAQTAIERERRELASRLQAVEAAMAKERSALAERGRALDERERVINNAIARAQARAHDSADYTRAAFVVYRRLRGDMMLDIEYEVPQTDRVDGCGLYLNPNDPTTPQMVQRIATALAALGVDPQIGVKAEPPVGNGRRYTANQADFRNLGPTPPPGSRLSTAPN